MSDEVDAGEGSRADPGSVNRRDEGGGEDAEGQPLRIKTADQQAAGTRLEQPEAVKPVPAVFRASYTVHGPMIALEQSQTVPAVRAGQGGEGAPYTEAESDGAPGANGVRGPSRGAGVLPRPSLCPVLATQPVYRLIELPNRNSFTRC